MRYDITLKSAPVMPNLGKGLDFIKLALTQISPDMREPIASALFDAAAAQMSGCEFLYPDLTWKEPCGMMDALCANSAGGKGQLGGYVEAMMRASRLHDETALRKLVEWQRAIKSKAANKEKPTRPDDELWITEGCSDCWAMPSDGHKAIAIPSATLLSPRKGVQAAPGKVFSRNFKKMFRYRTVSTAIARPLCRNVVPLQRKNKEALRKNKGPV